MQKNKTKNVVFFFALDLFTIKFTSLILSVLSDFTVL